MLVTSLDIPEANTKGTISGTDSCTSVGASFLGLFSLLNPLIMCVRFVRSILRHYFRRPETTEILFKKLEEKGKAKSPFFFSSLSALEKQFAGFSQFSLKFRQSKFDFGVKIKIFPYCHKFSRRI